MAVDQALEQSKSILNPVDASMMAQDGEVRPDMSVEQYLQKIGIDPKGPVTQLADWFKGQQQKADPAQKMQRIAASSRQPQFPQGRKPMVQKPQGGGLNDLI